MQIKDNQSKSKQYRIYVKGSKSWWMSTKNSIQTTTATSTLIASASRNMAAASVLLASATYATWIV